MCDVQWSGVCAIPKKSEAVQKSVQNRITTDNVGD